jgi:hypothetical protein
MFCENCGNKIQEGNKFCTKCGHSNLPISTNELKQNKLSMTNDKWWHRLFKIFYIFLYLQILWIVPVVWTSNDTSYGSYYSGTYHYQDTPGAAFLYSVFAIVIFIVVLRLFKLSVLYVLIGQRPEWNKEFKKLF